MNDKYYDLETIGKMLLTSVGYLRKMVKERKLKAKYIGGKYIVSEIDLQDFVNTLGVKDNERL